MVSIPVEKGKHESCLVLIDIATEWLELIVKLKLMFSLVGQSLQGKAVGWSYSGVTWK